jgi:excisionase family DNA binding protein
MNRTHKRWTEQEKILACQLLSQFTIKQVSKKMNRSVGSIKEIASNELKGSYCRSKRFREIEGLLQSHVAKQLGVSRSHVNNWVKMNNLPAIKCGKKGFYVINEKSLFDWLRSGYVMLPMIKPQEEQMKDWVCYQRTQFLVKFTSSQYFRKINFITRGALDNWIRNFNFPKPVKKIGKLGGFFDRKEVIFWAKSNRHMFQSNKIIQLSSYEAELDFFNQKNLYQCKIRHSTDVDI